MNGLSMPTALASTPAPTYLTSAISNRPWIGAVLAPRSVEQREGHVEAVEVLPLERREPVAYLWEGARTEVGPVGCLDDPVAVAGDADRLNVVLFTIDHREHLAGREARDAMFAGTTAKDHCQAGLVD